MVEAHGTSRRDPCSIGAFDAHLGAIGAGITPNTLVKIIGTSTCDLMVAPMSSELDDIPGLCGIVPESILPDYYGLEAGQIRCTPGISLTGTSSRSSPHTWTTCSFTERRSQVAAR